MLFTTYNDMELEVILSEYRRSRLMILVLVVLFVVTVFNFLFLSDSVALLPGGKWIFTIIGVWLAILICFEGIVLVRIHWFHKRGLQLPFGFKLIPSLIEISFPSILLWYLVIRGGNFVFVDSPLFLVYFLIIILSTLHLDPKISILVALLAALEYGWIIFAGFHKTQRSSLPLLPQPAYYSRCIMLLLSGLASGFVARQIKLRINAFIRINQLKRNIELRFGQQVSREIANALTEQGDNAKKMEASILVMDIRNFTSFASHHSPSEILDYQNKIFSPVLSIIKTHQGIVHQILGDGIMALFGVPVPMADHAFNALTAAIEIRAMLENLNATTDISPARIGIGIDSGEVITGNIGNEERKQYSISGTPVIIAFRVEQLNKDLHSDLLVTKAFKNKINEGLVESIDMGLHQLKGFNEPTQIYQVIRMKTPTINNSCE